MTNGSDAVRQHYAMSGILDRVTAFLLERGIDPERPTYQDFFPFDQLHGGGAQATREHIERAGIKSSMHVMDLGCGVGGCTLEIVQQDNTFAVFLQLGQHRADDLLGLADLEVEGIHVGRENGDVALAQIGDVFGRMAERREAEKRRGRMAQTPLHGADALFDLILGILERQLREILV